MSGRRRRKEKKKIHPRNITWKNFRAILKGKKARVRGKNEDGEEERLGGEWRREKGWESDTEG